MRHFLLVLLLVVVGACGSSPKRDPVPGPTLDETSSTEPTTARITGQTEEARCLPLIGCGCFMQCSMGFFEEPETDEWKVNYYDTMVMAKVEKQCVDGNCDDVFGVHTCQKTCAPEALKVTCELERGTLITCEERPRRAP